MEALEIPGSIKGHAARIENLLALLSDGAKVPEACAKVGIDKTTYYRWIRAHEDFRQAVTEAMARHKVELLQSWTKAGRDGHRSTETRTRTYREGGKDITETEVIERHLAPDWRAAQAMLRARHPEEYGHVNRIDFRRIGGSEQIDAGEAPGRPTDPENLINMILAGDTYVPEAEVEDLPEGDEPF
jgi:hypothetical protein